MKTLALVIGINNYYGSYALDNAINDANGIRNVFERLGYDVIYNIDGNSESIVKILSEFEERIETYDATIFYFAGHGFEIDGENYLAFSECQIDNPNIYHCKQTCIQLSDLLNIYKKYSNKINIAIIDACRKSFERSGMMASRPIQAPKGTLVAFSTSPSEGASDVGFEGNSIFTGALLKYIGRERTSVEELFKKVRKTVFNLSNGKQTTWEHTSLIGDFYFNTGQLIHSVDIPYSDDVVKDINFKSEDEFGNLIKEIKSYDWNIQNPAITKVLRIAASSLNKNQKFILGRNLLQASGAAFRAESFMKDLPSELDLYFEIDGVNHVLNGILFEIYFNPQAEFRKDKTKMYFFDEIISLRKNPKFVKSFNFIRNLIASADYPLIYIPSDKDEIFDIDVVANIETDSIADRIRTFQNVSKITFNSIDITKAISKHYIYWKTEEEFKEILSQYLCTPVKMLQINANVKLNSVYMDMEKGE